MSGADAPLCAIASREARETLVGTASRDGARFLLVEAGEPWGRDPMVDSLLPMAVKERLAAAAEARPGTRIAFVRPVGREEPVPRLYVAGGSPRAERVVRVDLPSYEAVCALPLESWLDGETAGTTPVDPIVVLVCTHGKRDRCCAKFGVALAQSLAREPGLLTLQASHLGGHRFAAIAVTLPDGMTYGHLSEDDASAFADAVRERRIFDAPRFRGRAGLDEPAQVADAHVRITRGLGADAPLTVLDIAKDVGGAVVTLALADERVQVRVRRRELPTLRPASCFDEPTPSYTFDVG